MNFAEYFQEFKNKRVLTEMNFQDLYGKTFVQFHDKYKRKGLKDDTRLYVNFTSDPAKFNLENKNYVDSPSHGDPAGIYGYPLKYVIDYPSDIRYGKSAAYLRVLRLRDSANVMWLNHMSESEMRSLYFKVHPKSDFESDVKLMKKFADIKSTAAAWFKLLQFPEDQIDALHEYFKEKKRNRFNTSKPDLKAKSAIEQNKMWLSLGYIAILDDATRPTKAAINEWEPEQICFLRRDAFDVVEVFNLSGTNHKHDPKEFITNVSDTHEERMYRKIAAGIASGIGDALMSSRGYTSNQGGYSVYFTNKGRQIGIAFSTPDSYYDNKKFGEKPHREFRKSDNKYPEVFIRSEKGDKGTMNWRGFSDDSFNDIVDSVVTKWNSTEETTGDTKFVSVRSAKDYEDIQKELRIKAFFKKKIDDIEKYVDPETYLNDFKELSNQLGVSFEEPADLNKFSARLYEQVGMALFSNLHNADSIDDSSVSSAFDKVWNAPYTKELRNLGDNPSKQQYEVVSDIVSELLSITDTVSYEWRRKEYTETFQEAIERKLVYGRSSETREDENTFSDVALKLLSKRVN